MTARVTETTQFNDYSCWTAGYDQTRTLSYTVASRSNASTALATVDTVNAYGIVVAFQSTDFVSSTTLTPLNSTTTPTPGSSPYSVAPTTSAVAIPEQSLTPVKSLSTGAKAGIGIGVSLGILILLVGVALGYSAGRKKARKRAPPIPITTTAEDSAYMKPELESPTQIPPQELYSPHTSAKYDDMPGIVHELETDTPNLRFGQQSCTGVEEVQELESTPARKSTTGE